MLHHLLRLLRSHLLEDNESNQGDQEDDNDDDNNSDNGTNRGLLLGFPVLVCCAPIEGGRRFSEEREA